jgi:hypothetical protein
MTGIKTEGNNDLRWDEIKKTLLKKNSSCRGLNKQFERDYHILRESNLLYLLSIF